MRFISLNSYVYEIHHHQHWKITNKRRKYKPTLNFCEECSKLICRPSALVLFSVFRNYLKCFKRPFVWRHLVVRPLFSILFLHLSCILSITFTLLHTYLYAAYFLIPDNAVDWWKLGFLDFKTDSSLKPHLIILIFKENLVWTETATAHYNVYC